MRRLFQEELLSVNVIRCLSRRPPKVLVQDFDSAWASADAPGRKELKESVFGMLRGWAFARPDKAADRWLVQRSCHDKAEVVRKEVLSLQMWHEPGRFEELQALCTERSAAVLVDMFAIRDALAAEPGGDGHFVVEELESFGSSVLAVIPPADDLLKSGKDNAKFQAALDETVLVHVKQRNSNTLKNLCRKGLSTLPHVQHEILRGGICALHGYAVARFSHRFAVRSVLDRVVYADDSGNVVTREVVFLPNLELPLDDVRPTG